MRRLLSLAATALAVVAVPAFAAISSGSQTQIVEYYNAALDHYFITADATEQSDLDNGVHAGWARTGLSFQGLKIGATLTGSTPVCRFYGKPEAGLDSHFYSASAAECQAVKDKFADQWQFESGEVFRAYTVDANSGKCPTDTAPVYRLWNKRADVNHRYTDQISVFNTMVAKGYVAEGDGDPKLPVAFCTPIGSTATPTSPAGSPSCTISPQTLTPAVGTIVALTTVCTGAPTSYTWTGCTSTTGVCQATSNTAGNLTYSVRATNSSGIGAAAPVTLAWQGASGPVPICTMSGTTATPSTGGNLGLSANCSQAPTRYDWMECSYMTQSACNIITSCSPTSPNCAVSSSNPGFSHYAVQAANSAGVGPRVGFDAEWKSGGTPSGTSAPVCSLSSSDNAPAVGGAIVLAATCSGTPTSYAWTGCTSNGTSCTVSSSTPGPRTFSVVASNNAGNSAPASLTVSWGSGPTPNCSVTASKNSPTVNQSITLSASCSGSPTSFQWTGCTSSGAQCTAVETAAGAKTYSVVATNAVGSSPQANVTVNWQAAPTAAPACTVTSNNASPFTGGAITLTASCSNQPASYAWTGCSSTSSTCTATSSTAGAVNYSVTATNVVGTSAAASTTVNWQQSTAAADYCSAYSDVVRISKVWASGPETYPSDYGGAFRANMVLVVAVTVPASAANVANTLFSAAVSEYGDAPTIRDMRLSLSPCDFNRPIDPTGANGPISAGYNGQTVSVSGVAGRSMQPGQTYYISVRNYSALSGITCKTGTCNLHVGYQWPK